MQFPIPFFLFGRFGPALDARFPWMTMEVDMTVVFIDTDGVVKSELGCGMGDGSG